MHYPIPPSGQGEARESTLSWFICALNGSEPKKRREPLRQILGPSDWDSVAGEDRVSRYKTERGPKRSTVKGGLR